MASRCGNVMGSGWASHILCQLPAGHSVATLHKDRCSSWGNPPTVIRKRCRRCWWRRRDFVRRRVEVGTRGWSQAAWDWEYRDMAGHLR